VNLEASVELAGDSSGRGDFVEWPTTDNNIGAVVAGAIDSGKGNRGPK